MSIKKNTAPYKRLPPGAISIEPEPLYFKRKKNKRQRFKERCETIFREVTYLLGLARKKGFE
jgi:hypothetical protein